MDTDVAYSALQLHGVLQHLLLEGVRTIHDIAELRDILHRERDRGIFLVSDTVGDHLGERIGIR